MATYSPEQTQAISSFIQQFAEMPYFDYSNIETTYREHEENTITNRTSIFGTTEDEERYRLAGILKNQVRRDSYNIDLSATAAMILSAKFSDDEQENFQQKVDIFESRLRHDASEVNGLESKYRRPYFSQEIVDGISALSKETNERLDGFHEITRRRTPAASA